MATVTAPAPPVSLSAPLPAPRSYTLLDVATLVPPANDRWLAGAQIEGYASGPAFTQETCATGTDAIKEEPGTIPLPEAGAFTVYLSARCTAQSIGANPQFWTDRLRLDFEAKEAQAVERVLAFADGHGSVLGAFLTDTNMEELASGAAVSPIEGLALLEQAIGAAQNGMGVIHAGPAVATYWAASYAIESKGNIMYTQLGTPVVIGAGYIDAPPPNGSDLTATEEWAFASGPIEITRSEVFINPANYSEALDRSNNDVRYFAERYYLINWVARQSSSDTDHVQAGVMIDRTS